MLKDDQFHYLIKATYQPRVAAATLASFITLSQFVGNETLPSYMLGFLSLTLLYPHIIYWTSGLFFNGEASSRIAMIFDGLLVGTFIVINGFYLFTTITFLAALVFSTAVIAKPKILMASLIGLGLVVSFGWTIGFEHRLTSSSLTDSLCSIFLLFYSAMVAYQVFNINSRLRQSRDLVQLDNKALAGITEHLRRYISPQLYAEITRRSLVGKKTNRKRLTIFFSDIEGFTEIMDNLEEETVTQILNEYLNAMAEIAIEHGGTIDKFMGDGIMIFFGDPRTRGAKQDALACLRMALEMGRRLKSLRAKWQEAGVYSDLHMRIGINTGYCAVGNFGSENRMDYTVVGGVVNLASRLESHAGRDAILISNGTYSLVSSHIECHEQLPLKVKGLNKPVQNYLVLCEKGELGEPMIERESRGFSISFNPALADISNVRALINEIDSSLGALERKQQESKASVRLLN